MVTNPPSRWFFFYPCGLKKGGENEVRERKRNLFGAIVVSLPPISLSLNILGGEGERTTGRGEGGRENRALYKVGNVGKV